MKGEINELHDVFLGISSVCFEFDLISKSFFLHLSILRWLPRVSIPGFYTIHNYIGLIIILFGIYTHCQ